MIGMTGEISTVRIERRGRIALLTIDNPSRGNAITKKVLAELGEAVTEIEGDRALRAAVISGAGERAFCTGADISAWSELDAVEFALLDSSGTSSIRPARQAVGTANRCDQWFGAWWRA
jgi:enoyl-CoA hydratase/carnithine racemase